MRSDDETHGDPGQAPGEGGAVGGEPIGGETADSSARPSSPAAQDMPASPWQPVSRSGWGAPQSSTPGWGAPPSGPAGWGAPVPPAPPAWGPGPDQPYGGQYGGSWGAQPGWSPQNASGFGTGYPPTAPGFGVRRSSGLPKILVVIAACMIAFSAGLVTDHSFFPTTSSCATSPTSGGTPVPAGAIPSCSSAGSPYGSLQGYDLYQQAVQIVKQNFVGRSSVTDQQLLYGGIRGMIDSLGDTGHSVFLTPQEYAAWQASLSASVAGIGVMLSSDNNVFTITRVIAGSPAEAAGVKAGDQITAIEGVSTAGMTMTDVGTKIRGDPGTKVTISVIHLGSTTPVDIVITRAKIAVPLADWGMVPGTHVADIVLTEFSQGAADQVQKYIVAAQKAGATSIILDLRGNPGGYAAEAQLVASEFLTDGVVYIQQDAAGTNSNVSVDTSRPHNNLPLVVLVDHNSASAAEIVAGALQDNGRAKIVGVPTFGTGTVLEQFPLSDGSVIILGTSWWLTPKGHRIFGVGITPDQKVAMGTGGVAIYPTALATMSAAQFSSSSDAQLQAAVKDLSN